MPAAAHAHGYLDPTFGKGGRVDLTTRPGSAQFARLERVSVGPEGEVYFLEEATTCGSSSCSTQIYLRRYTAAGAPDPAFGGGRVSVGTAIRTGYGSSGVLTVDARGRPLVASISEGLVTVRRFSRDGSPDSSFGTGGATTVRCDCFLDSIEARPGDGVLVLGHSNIERIEALQGTIWFLARLDENGFLDPGFGSAGVAWRAMSGLGAPAAKLTAGGGALLYASSCCAAVSRSFLQRLTSEGSLQRRFAAAAKRSLRAFRDETATPPGVAVLPRSRGRADVVGEAGEHGALVRLRHDGTRDPRWGRRPPWGPRFRFLDAAGDGFGGTFVVGSYDWQRRRYLVIRLRPDGRFDRRFGGVELPDAYDEEGLEIFSRGRGGAIVFSAGRSFCRGSCLPHPRLYGVVGVRR
jgi:uncharacterized delta-60 repeat protein